MARSVADRLHQLIHELVDAFGVIAVSVTGAVNHSNDHRRSCIEVDGLGVHGLRATAATNDLEHEADIAKVQAWLGHCQYQHNQNLRSAREQARGLTDLQGEVLIEGIEA